MEAPEGEMVSMTDRRRVFQDGGGVSMTGAENGQVVMWHHVVMAATTAQRGGGKPAWASDPHPQEEQRVWRRGLKCIVSLCPIAICMASEEPA